MIGRADLENLIRGYAEAIGGSLDDLVEGGGVGYAVLLFNFGAEGNMAYGSNANRKDMIKALRELIAELEVQ